MASVRVFGLRSVTLLLILTGSNWCYCEIVRCATGKDPRIPWGIQVDCSNLGIANIPNRLSTVNVTSLLLNHNFIELVKETDFSNFTELRYLDLSDNKLVNVSSTAFVGVPKLIFLNLSFNKLSSWPGDAVSSLLDLQELYLDGAIASELIPPPSGFGTPKRLEKLVISDLQFGVINRTLFSAAAASITFLDMSACRFAGVEPGAFRYLTSIQQLKLNVPVGLNFTSLSYILSDLDNTNLTSLGLFGMDNLTSVDKTLFSNFKRNVLQTLVLSYSAVGDISPEAFSVLSSLRNLYLDNTELREIKADSFVGLDSLTFLDISGTHLNGYNFSGSGLRKLHILNMSYSQYLFKMKSYGFSGLDQLTDLIIDYGNVEMLEVCAFCGLHNLKRLSMQNLQFERIDEKAFSGLASLEVLDLTEAGISYLNKSLFTGMTSLKSLTLDYNNLNKSSRVSPNTFTVLPNLTYLSMEYCKLSSDCGLFRNLAKLTTLSLMGNAGINLKDDAFVGCSNLTTLILSDINTMTLLPTALNNLTLDHLDVSFDGLANVSLSNVSYLASTKVRRFAGEGNPYSCSCDNLAFIEWFNKTDKIADDREVYRCGDRWISQFDAAKCINTIAFNLSVSISVLLVASVGTLLAYLNRWRFNQIWYRFRLQHYRKLEEQREVRLRREKEYDAFISCSDKDVDFVVQSLIPKLEGDNFKLYFEHRDFPIGACIAEEICRAVEISRKTIVVMSENYIKDGWKMSEYELAYFRRAEGETVVIVVLYGEVNVAEMPHTAVNLLGSDNCIEWPIDDEEGQEVFWRDLKDALNNSTILAPTSL